MSSSRSASAAEDEGARGNPDPAAAVEPVEVGVAGAVDPDPLGGQRRRLGPRVLERVDGGGDLAHDPDGGRGLQRAVGDQLIEPPPRRRLRDRDRAALERPRAIHAEQVRVLDRAQPARAFQEAGRRQRPGRVAGDVQRDRALVQRVTGQQYGGACVLALDRLDPIPRELASRMKLSHECH